MVEGNIGAGKTFFLNTFRDWITRNQIPNVLFLFEPINIFDYKFENSDNTTKALLQLQYENPKRWSALFQNMLYLARWKNMCDMSSMILDSSAQTTFVIMERSMMADRLVFMKKLEAEGNITPLELHMYKLLTSWYNETTFKQLYPEATFIWVNINIPNEICFERTKSRGRKEENSLTRKHFDEIAYYYEQMFSSLTNECEYRMMPFTNDYNIVQLLNDVFVEIGQSIYSAHPNNVQKAAAVMTVTNNPVHEQVKKDNTNLSYAQVAILKRETAWADEMEKINPS